MGPHYVYKIFRKIKIVKYCKRWPNRIYRTELLVCQHYKLLKKINVISSLLGQNIR